ncbi:unnamed protein product [Dicrocoelium dendriticum]|nr:unnamed protein product [Dicrocoelium dendriticum]
MPHPGWTFIDLLIPCLIYFLTGFSDTRFLVGQKLQPIYGHKAIVACRCPAISASLLPNTGELMQSSRSSHVLREVEPDIFRIVMRFMYTNCISLINLSIFKLIDVLKASLRFELTELTKLAESRLITLIDKNTVFEVLNLAVKYKSADLKNAAIKFISHSAKVSP